VITATNSDDHEETAIRILHMPLTRERHDLIMSRIIQEIEEAFCGPEFQADPDHDCPLYAISVRLVETDDEGRTPEEAELDLYRERYGPVEKLTAERFNPADERYPGGRR
jgi:hypothetical protein